MPASSPTIRRRIGCAGYFGQGIFGDFNMMAEVKKGDVIALDYQPSGGTSVSVNGVAKGNIAGRHSIRHC